MKYERIFLVAIGLFFGLLVGLSRSTHTFIYRNPDILAEQTRLLEDSMEGWDRCLKLLRESNGLLEEVIK